jgi:hypothetical protein
MPILKWSRTVATGLSDAPISAQTPPWQYEFLPWPAECALLQRATVVSVLETVFSGSETIAQEQAMQAGGTAGSTPSPLNTTPIQWNGAGGDRVMVNNRNTNAGSATIDGLIAVQPLLV